MFRQCIAGRLCFFATVVCAFLIAQPALACPTCKDSLTEQYVAAYGYSIMFMMSMPFLILASLGLYFYWEVRRARKQQQAKLSTEAESDERMPVPSG